MRKLNNKIGTWQDIQLEVILNSAASFKPKLQMREYSIDDILVGGPEERGDFGSIFRLLDSGVFVGVLRVGIVGVSPFVLPTHVVGVAVVVTDFIIFDRVQKALEGGSCR